MKVFLKLFISIVIPSLLTFVGILGLGILESNLIISGSVYILLVMVTVAIGIIIGNLIFSLLNR